VNSVLVVGDRENWTDPLVRVHSSCLTGDVFGSERCECGPQLHSAINLIDRDDQGGLLIYMAGHEGRGIGLWAKAATYLLQDGGEDTYQANRSLGLPDDSRDFSDAADLIRHFRGDGPFRLLTNNPKKLADLKMAGLDQITPVKHVIGVTESNRRYLAAKQGWGHKIDPDDIV
jgi:GTP cyclohydrolase II